MILIVTNRRDFTADYLVLELNRRRAEYARLNTEDYPICVGLSMSESSSAPGQRLLLDRGLRLDLDRVRSVWFRRPVSPQVDLAIREPHARALAETEATEALEGLWRTLDCRWVSQPDAIRRAESKPLQLHLARELGFSIPDTLLTSDPAAAAEFVGTHHAVICKPLRCGQVDLDRGLQLIYTTELTEEDERCIADVSLAPTLLQERIAKTMDVRVTVVGTRAFSAGIDSQADPRTSLDWRRGDSAGLKYSMHVLPRVVEEQCVELVDILGLRFGAIDLVLAHDGRYVFLDSLSCAWPFLPAPRC